MPSRVIDDRAFRMKKIDPPLKIASPCSQDWNGMEGDERKRFCAQCGKHVFNLSAMTEREGKAFAEETQGRECVAYVQSADGAIATPNRFERLMLHLSGRLPRMAALFSMMLPAALVSCASRKPQGPTQVTPGMPWIPPEPVTRTIRHQPDGPMTLGEPVVVPRSGARNPDAPMTLGTPAIKKD